ncbi:hypothetical protein PIB30_093743, partial [Stylosanthes scabra]|nr:hypothetical protein [Stylosanthes scabra]
MVINVFKAMQYPEEEDVEGCMRIDIIEELIKEVQKDEAMQKFKAAHESPPTTPCTPPRDCRRSVPASRRLVLATLTHTLVSLPPPLTALSCVLPPVPPPSSPQGSSKFVVLSRLLPSNRRIILSRSSSTTKQDLFSGAVAASCFCAITVL